ncbi:MAG: M23 family metallopeptidase [Chloroflexi bacterium]|nr:M23 family metallopeptidase [Chloroflexota bacterium]
MRTRLLAMLLALLLAGTASAFLDEATPPAWAAGEPPFGLPFADPPGPSTWLVGQAYGNTTGAYSARRSQYSRGQGVHFGVDLSAPCGTVVVAIGDGIVAGADGPWGSLPHNLMIDHANGYSSMYGHLLEMPKLQRGQPVRKGQPVALTGDPDETCYSRPHLHLEIRSANYIHWYNPMVFINADWDSLALTGSFSRGFEKDLDNPRQWQTLLDQPEVDFNQPFLNEYARPWPPSPGTR